MASLPKRHKTLVRYVAEATEVFRKNKNLKGRILLALIKHINVKHWSCFPSTERLAQMANCTRETVSRTIKLFKQMGFLHVEYRIDPETKINMTNVYTIDFKAMMQAIRPWQTVKGQQQRFESAAAAVDKETVQEQKPSHGNDHTKYLSKDKTEHKEKISFSSDKPVKRSKPARLSNPRSYLAECRRKVSDVMGKTAVNVSVKRFGFKYLNFKEAQAAGLNWMDGTE
ncbi:helix-turn-helix domain-containing protein [Vibrio breoganii]|uniref:helix-turn-helix domain-containing protein n=1 Tax=Vibrio breoganii TaxID=553239 RepID=UPI000C824810|nr:helix-turn-helix domain-containing protein [Vibrio breoganii]PMK30628.1 hypothetical protein BCU03_09430 [Vibrio breoganii]